jgi:GNAT superfamily N-acetyltransferase
MTAYPLTLTDGAVIRPAEPHDLERVAELCQEHASYEGANCERAGLAARLQSHWFTTGERPRRHCLVAVFHGRIEGFASFCTEFSTWDGAEYMHMDCLFLTPLARGQGIGAALLEQVRQSARRLGCIGVQWQTPTSNREAIRFYERVGATSKPKLRFFLEP